ncbi:MAG: hypothetical protein Sw2PiMacB_27210 [Shewanella algae]
MEGMKRRGFAKETQQALRRAYKTLYRSSLTLEEAVAAMAEDAAKEPQVQAFVDFVTSSNRGIIR